MAEVKVSIIVTIHNAERYIRECLDSALAQTFEDIEILCMDGGSSDATPEILKQYAAQDRRVRIINDANTSYGHKVNRGVEESRGEYVCVLESDDMYEPFMVERLYEIVEQYHPDFVNADYTCFFNINGVRFTSVTKMYHEADYNCLINYKEQPERFGSIPRYWTGLFSKEYLNREQIKMNESPGAAYQDTSFRFLTSVLAESAYHLELPVYLYRVDNPLSSVYDQKKTVVIVDEHIFLRNELRKRNITNEYIWENAYRWKYINIRGNLQRLYGERRQELFERYREELRNDWEELKKYDALWKDGRVKSMLEETPEKLLMLFEHMAVEREKDEQRLYLFLQMVTGLSKNQQVVVFGCGCMGKRAIRYLKEADKLLCCVTDNDSKMWGTQMEQIMILSPKQAVEAYPEAYYIVANKKCAGEISKQLRELGILPEMVYEYK